MTRSLSFELPLPPAELSPNGQGAGSREKAAPAKAEYRASCALIARGALNRAAWEAPAKARVTLDFGTGRVTRRTVEGRRVTLRDGFYRPTDHDNAIAAMKAGMDGLRDAGLFVDDTAERMEMGRPQIDSSVGPWVRVTVEAVS